MKKLFIIVALSLSFFACDSDWYGDPYEHSFVVSGDCKFVVIEDLSDQSNDLIIYHGLPAPYEVVGSFINNKSDGKTISYSVEKELDDASTVSAEIVVDGITLDSKTTSDPYGKIIVSCTIGHL